MQATDPDYNKNLAAWLLTYRNTPHSVSKQCPSALMFGRLTRTRLSLLYPCKPLYTRQEQEVIEQGLFREFKVGDPVYYKDIRKQSWHVGTVQARQGSKVYRILGENGVVDKHIDQLKTRYTVQLQPARHYLRLITVAYPLLLNLMLVNVRQHIVLANLIMMSMTSM